jgi:hypothetical protein
MKMSIGMKDVGINQQVSAEDGMGGEGDLGPRVVG